MKIEILKDNLFKQHYSAIIEKSGCNEDRVFELLDPIGYGETPIKALEHLLCKLRNVVH